MRVAQRSTVAAGPALVTGAGGQDGYLLARRLLAEGHEVHALVRRASSVQDLPRGAEEEGRFVVHEQDLVVTERLEQLVRTVRPDEVYNLAGQSSVSASFADPRATWRTNVDPVVTLLEAIRTHSPGTVLYQSSSSEMFGGAPSETVVHDEDSPLLPQSPYAAAKAAAHLACRAYREGFGVRVACGILFNHESSRRPGSFLSRKVVDHVQRVRAAGGPQRAHMPPLAMGNLKVRRDWGFAPDYVDGILLVARQIRVRAAVLGQPVEPNVGRSYRDYVLGTGRLHAVWELVDRAFACAGFELDWALDAPDPAHWEAHFRDSGALAVKVDPSFLRPADPVAIQADPGRARRELGWSPRQGLDVFLKEMLQHVS